MLNKDDPRLLRNTKDRAPEWVLDGYIPKRFVSMIASPMNMGKTHVGVWMAKEASTGSPLALDKPQNVWFNTHEDDREMVLRPRMMVAGANPDRVLVTSESWQFPADIETVRAELKACTVDMLILDTAQTHIPSHTATGPATEAMLGLLELAQELNIAIVVVHHFVKGGDIGGASVLQSLCRGGIFIIGPKPTSRSDVIRQLEAADSDDPNVRAEAEVDQYVLACKRMGMGPPSDSLLFNLATKPYAETKRNEAWLELVEPVPFTYDQVLKSIKVHQSGKAGDMTRERLALAWLLEVLTSRGAMPVNALIEEAKAVGIAKRTLERARADAKGEGLIEVIRPEDLSDDIGEDAYESLSKEERRGWWLRKVEDLGEPPVEEWSKEQ